MKDLILKAADLTLFINTTNDTTATTGNDLSPEMKTYYSDYLIDTAEPLLIHDQFGQKHNIPANGGKTIEFRKYDSLPKATTPLTEGVKPTGQALNVTTISSTVHQYGDYVALTDLLLLTAIDNNLVQATKLLGSQAGRTLDTITREIINSGTVVQYCGGVSSRADLVGGASTGNCYMTVEEVRKAARYLKVMNAEKINGFYVGIIHPDVAHDLMSDSDWKYPHQYQDTENIYNGEIGAIAGVRFVETTEAKLWKKAGKNDTTASDRDVYSTLIVGDNAYGVTEISGGGLKHIVKNLGSAGTADPLDQVATAGWKATKTAEILVQQYMVRVESTSTFNDAPEN